jgi:hypothetical protein
MSGMPRPNLPGDLGGGSLTTPFMSSAYIAEHLTRDDIQNMLNSTRSTILTLSPSDPKLHLYTAIASNLSDILLELAKVEQGDTSNDIKGSIQQKLDVVTTNVQALERVSSRNYLAEILTPNWDLYDPWKVEELQINGKSYMVAFRDLKYLTELE